MRHAIALLAIVIVAPCLAQESKETQLTEYSQEGTVGSLGRHTESYRGRWLENAANCRRVLPDGSAVMFHFYAITTRRDGMMRFVLKGVDTKGWESGDIKELPRPLKVTGWQKVEFDTGVREIQVLEPVNKSKENEKK